MLDVPFRFSCISYEKSAYSQDLWSIWPQLALAPNYHSKARADLLRAQEEAPLYAISFYIASSLLTSRNGWGGCLETQFTSRTPHFYLDGLLGFVLICSCIHIIHFKLSNRCWTDLRMIRENHVLCYSRQPFVLLANLHGSLFFNPAKNKQSGTSKSVSQIFHLISILYLVLLENSDVEKSMLYVYFLTSYVVIGLQCSGQHFI